MTTRPTAHIRGIIAACLTPFSPNGEVDYGALEKEIEFLVADVDAIAVGAVEAAEYTLLPIPKRMELMRVAAEFVAGRVPLILGASAPAIREVAALGECAADCGAAAVQVLMPTRPWGGEPSTKELVNYFSEITNSTTLPVAAYHNPTVGADPPVPAWVELADLPGVSYFKESSRDISKIARLIEHIELSGRAHYFTTMQPLLITLLLGGSGATMPPPATRIAVQVVRAVRAGDIGSAVTWQRLFSAFPAAWASYGLVPVMKAAMAHFGVELGAPAAPYLAMQPEHDRQLGEFLRSTGLLTGDVVSDEALTAAVAKLDPTNAPSQP